MTLTDLELKGHSSNTDWRAIPFEQLTIA